MKRILFITLVTLAVVFLVPILISALTYDGYCGTDIFPGNPNQCSLAEQLKELATWEIIFALYLWPLLLGIIIIPALIAFIAGKINSKNNGQKTGEISQRQ